MKTTTLLLLFATCLALIAACQSSAPAPAAGWHKSVQLTVMKVFSARDGDALFRAYAVRWKDQEVVVSDPLVQSDYHVGDTITVLVMSQAYPMGREKYGLLAFQVIPAKYGGSK
jgi:hypothetical protein